MLNKRNVFCGIDLKNFSFKTLLYYFSLVTCLNIYRGEVVGQGKC